MCVVDQIRNGASKLRNHAGRFEDHVKDPFNKDKFIGTLPHNVPVQKGKGNGRNKLGITGLSMYGKDNDALNLERGSRDGTKPSDRY
tara:strand:- start:56 stop:316 length:261 start_codon:yes stop_codon:yes gene_type:complete